MAQRTIDAAAIEAEVDHIRSLGIDALRARWRTLFGAVPPKGLTKDMIGRMTAYRILHSPLAGPPMIAGKRHVLLTAIAKARAWIADLAEGRAASFAEIAKHEGKVERHIRLLAPLALYRQFR
jgi:hypothetical protein